MATQEKSVAQRRFNPVHVTEQEINSVLITLTNKLSGTLENKFTSGFYSQSPLIDGQHNGYACRVIGMASPNSGLTKGISMSLVVQLPKQTQHRLRAQNLTALRYSFYVGYERVEATPEHNMSDDVAAKVFPTELHYELLRSGLNFILTVKQDRITLTTYGIYKHELYIALFDALTAMASALMEV